MRGLELLRRSIALEVAQPGITQRKEERREDLLDSLVPKAFSSAAVAEQNEKTPRCQEIACFHLPASAVNPGKRSGWEDRKEDERKEDGSLKSKTEFILLIFLSTIFFSPLRLPRIANSRLVAAEGRARLVAISSDFLSQGRRQSVGVMEALDGVHPFGIIMAVAARSVEEVFKPSRPG